MTFERLLGPGSLGPLALRNRVAMCPMGTNLGEPDGTVGEAQRAWYEARARGGTGLVIVGSVAVAYPDGSYDARQIGASDDLHLPGLRSLADAIHRHGAAVAAQLVHDGANSLHDIARGVPLLVPSRRRPPPPDELSQMLTADELAALSAPFATPTSSYAVREATDEDLDHVVSAFAAAAGRSMDAGFDAIELHAGHGYLLDAFLSPSTNRRTDRWGGGAGERAELLVAVVRAVRAAVGPDVAVWARVNAFDVHRDPPQTVDDALVAMGRAVDAGLDGLHVTASAAATVATGITDSHTPHAPGALLPAAARVRGELGVPVIGFGRLTPEAAEEALARGDVDVVAMGRPLIADPDLPRKLAEGHRDRVRPCAYQYRCIGSIFLNQPLRCTVNPDAGHEAEAEPAAAPPQRSAPGMVVGGGRAPAAAPQRVVVVGGGPAGMDAARRLADAGHHVELWEAAEHLGGRLAIAEAVSDDLAGLVGWLAGAAEDAGVSIRTGRRADAASLMAASPDLVVVAAGRDWSAPAGAVDVDRVGRAARGEPLPDGAVAVVGHRTAALRAALWLRTVGSHPVTLVAGEAVLAPELGVPGRFRLVADCRDAGVKVVTGVDGITVVEGVGVTWHGGSADATTAVWVHPSPVPSGLVAELPMPVALIGDADPVAPGGLEPAFHSARQLSTR